MEDFLSDKDIIIPPNYDEPLPRCQGPKLYPFKDRESDINFVRLLSSNDDSDETGQSYVFEVIISFQTFALKVFKFYDVNEDYAPLTAEERTAVSKNIVCAHMDPFFNECRAFGRIIEAGLNGKVAVPCYGHLTVSAKLEDELKRRFDVKEWHRPEPEYKEPVSRRQPFRAIVKTLLPTRLSMESKLVGKALRALKRMRRLKIYAMDIRARNYVAGTLVDLSNAITEKHFLFYVSPAWRVSLYQKEDLEYFDGMIEELGIQTWERALPKDAYRSKLRSGQELKEDKRLESAVRTWDLIEQDKASQASNAAQSVKKRPRATAAPKAQDTTRRKKNEKNAASKTSNIDKGSQNEIRVSHTKTRIASGPRRLETSNSASEAPTADQNDGKKAKTAATRAKRRTRLEQVC